jgi:hypothetical protein
MGGDRRRDEDYFFQVKGFSNFFRSPEMAQMDGIKGSSEKTHPLSTVFLFNVKPPRWSIQLKQTIRFFTEFIPSAPSGQALGQSPGPFVSLSPPVRSRFGEGRTVEAKGSE